MTALSRGTQYVEPSPSQQRLGDKLAGMIPGAVAVRVSLTHPSRQWPHPYTVAVDGRGEQLMLSGSTTKVAARWVLRSWPEADWTRPHTLDLATGQLAVASVRSR
ncbi:transcriptional regulator [Kitasatospora sp. NPDC127116]|uniref:transcriptional regulator n=1 Tax=Kitasatospora sp. NPDC127116 TaxID=3345367 RepID=UPI00362985E9